MSIGSSQVSPGAAILSEQYNGLRADLVDNHSHNGVDDGHAVDHTTLVSRGDNTHAEIDAHIAAPDGVHGLKDTQEFVMGSWSGHYTVIAFTATNGGAGYFITHAGQQYTLTLPVAMSGNYMVHITPMKHASQSRMCDVAIITKAASSVTFNTRMPDYEVEAPVGEHQSGGLTDFDIMIIGLPTR